MVFQHHSVLVVEDVVLNGELGATAGDGESASGGGDQAVPGDDVHRMGAAGGGGGSPQVLSQVQVAVRPLVQAGRAQVVVVATAAGDVLDDGGGPPAGGRDEDHAGVRH